MTDRLFVYGTLAPGRPKEHVLAEVSGTWEPATVRGKLLQGGWVAELGDGTVVYTHIYALKGTSAAEGPTGVS